MAYEINKCPVCQQIVEQTGKGRPKVYHPDCRKIEQLLTWLDTLIDEVDLSAAAIKNMKTRLFYLVNRLPRNKKE